MRLHKILPTCAVHWEPPQEVPFIVHDLPFREPMSYGGAWPYLYA